MFPVLPPGTLKALKGDTDAIVHAVFAATMVAGAFSSNPWAAVFGITIVTITYHLRQASRQRHAREMAGLKVEEASLAISAVAASHGGLLRNPQPALPLAKGRPAKLGGRSRTTEQGRT